MGFITVNNDNLELFEVDSFITSEFVIDTEVVVLKNWVAFTVNGHFNTKPYQEGMELCVPTFGFILVVELAFIAAITKLASILVISILVISTELKVVVGVAELPRVTLIASNFTVLL